MKSKLIDLYGCIELQECFFDGNAYSPFECVKEPLKFYPMALLGEIGCLINTQCKTVRSTHDYFDTICHDCNDIFLYLLLTGRILEKEYKNLKYSHALYKYWDKIDSYEGYTDVFRLLSSLNRLALQMITDHSTQIFIEFFKLFQYTNLILTERNWPDTATESSLQVLEEIDQGKPITPDLYYNGSFYINFKRLLKFIHKYDIKIPPKRVLFYQRLGDV